MGRSTEPPSVFRYYERWHRYAKEPVGPLTEGAARTLHADGEPYTVVVGDPVRPSCFVEVASDFYGVSFLDDHGREYLMYTFEEAEQERVFLKEATHREYAGDSSSVAKGTVYRFWPDGRVMIERSEPPFQRAQVSESHADVSRNWERKPEFGQYEQLISKDR